MTNAEKAVKAIRARVEGVWDDPYLKAVGCLSASLEVSIMWILEFYGV